MAEEETRRKREDNPGKESQIGTKTGVMIRSSSLNDIPSPRGVLEIHVAGSDSDSSSGSSGSIGGGGGGDGNTSSFSPRCQIADVVKPNKDFYGLKWRNMINTLKKKSLKRFSVVPLLTSHEVCRKNLRRRKSGKIPEDEIDIDCEIVSKPSWKNFYYSELAAATDNFSPENLVGKGGHAEVYKGRLQDGQIVAVKKLMKNDKEEDNKATDFLAELGIIAHINHPNAAHLIGFSIDKGLHFVLQFSPHGSLASKLFGSPESILDWKTRFKVAVGIADGLKYLHHHCQRRIIHRDIKASNILLDQDFEAQISDFGLAKWLPANWPYHVVHPVEGTFGYLAPEYFMHGIVDEKIDVFAYGVLLLELLTGRRAVDSARQSLAIWAKPLLESNKVDELVDPLLGNDYDRDEVARAMLTASMCIHHQSNLRPSMIRVVQLLKNEDCPVESQTKGCEGKAAVDGICDSQDYTRSSYLNDLNRHMQLVMEYHLMLLACLLSAASFCSLQRCVLIKIHVLFLQISCLFQQVFSCLCHKPL